MRVASRHGSMDLRRHPANTPQKSNCRSDRHRVDGSSVPTGGCSRKIALYRRGTMKSFPRDPLKHAGFRLVPERYNEKFSAGPPSPQLKEHPRAVHCKTLRSAFHRPDARAAWPAPRVEGPRRLSMGARRSRSIEEEPRCPRHRPARRESGSGNLALARDSERRQRPCRRGPRAAPGGRARRSRARRLRDGRRARPAPPPGASRATPRDQAPPCRQAHARHDGEPIGRVDRGELVLMRPACEERA